MTALTVASLHVFPIKSARGIDLDASMVEPRGLRFDRRWMVVNDQGRFLTQREHPRMARLETALADDHLAVSYEGQPTLQLSLEPEGEVREVQVWRDHCAALDMGEEAAAWFSKALGRPCRLVYMPDTTHRPVKRGLDTDHVSFADGYPLLVVSQASLEGLNARLDQPVSMARFRPNVVIAGASEPHVEDTWREIVVGDVTMVLVKPCSRCSITTLDPQSAARGIEPLRTLNGYRKHEGEVFFGCNAIARAEGCVRVGDVVRVEATQAAFMLSP